jgi:predicted metalloendopeptidase
MMIRICIQHKNIYLLVLHRQVKFDTMMATVGTNYSRNSFEFSALDTNAFYYSLTNSILFPAGILDSPMYSDRYPKLMVDDIFSFIVVECSIH